MSNPARNKLVRVDDIDIYSKYTALQLACANNHIDMLKLLLQFGADPDATNFNGETALHIACINANYKCIDLLLHIKANVLTETNNGENALVYACKAGKVGIVKRILDSDTSGEMKMVLSSGHPESLHAFSGNTCEKCWNFNEPVTKLLSDYWKKRSDWEFIDNANKMKEKFGMNKTIS